MFAKNLVVMTTNFTMSQLYPLPVRLKYWEWRVSLLSFRTGKRFAKPESKYYSNNNCAEKTSLQKVLQLKNDIDYPLKVGHMNALIWRLEIWRKHNLFRVGNEQCQAIRRSTYWTLVSRRTYVTISDHNDRTRNSKQKVPLARTTSK